MVVIEIAAAQAAERTEQESGFDAAAEPAGMTARETGAGAVASVVTAAAA